MFPRLRAGRSLQTLLLVGVVSTACDAKQDSDKSNDGLSAAGAPETNTVPSQEPSDTPPIDTSPDTTDSQSGGSTVMGPETEPSVEPTSDESTAGESTTAGPTSDEPPDATDDALPDDSAAAPSTADSGPGGSGNGGEGGAPPTGEAGAGEQPTEDACATALLCDDFDDDTAGMQPGAPWTSDTNGGSVEVSSERAFSGANSVHVSNSPGAYKRAFFSVSGEPLFPGAGQEMYGRMMMWLEATPAGSVHWTFIQGEGPSDDGSYDIFYRYGGQHEGKLMANFETQGKATDCWDHSETVMPTQTWACLEWRFNTATDEMQFWLDGTELSDIHPVGMGEGCVNQDLSGAWPAPAQFEVLRLGWEKYQESTQLDAWIDDVAVGTSRMGCPVTAR